MSNKWIFLRLFSALLYGKLDLLGAHRRKQGHRITTIVIQEARERWWISSLDNYIPRWHMFVATRSSLKNMWERLWVLECL
ncbi:hypothetical protein RDI58_026140 [Solanum bulbocastanum]|uniref:Secreted protein n=1 Tax=Solanum bulbocastanum TaxID=147425 RepID=A0AAN8SSH9_SOLBU